MDDQNNLAPVIPVVLPVIPPVPEVPVPVLPPIIPTQPLAVIAPPVPSAPPEPEWPGSKPKSKLPQILGGIAAIILVVGVATAAYFVSNKISGRQAVAPNAPESEPLAGRDGWGKAGSGTSTSTSKGTSVGGGVTTGLSGAKAGVTAGSGGSTGLSGAKAGVTAGSGGSTGKKDVNQERPGVSTGGGGQCQINSDCGAGQTCRNGSCSASGGGGGGGTTATTSSCTEQCPGSDGVLRSCTPPEADGSSNDSLCNSAGRVEVCGGSNYCCPSAGGAWTNDMTACPTAPTLTPTPVAGACTTKYFFAITTKENADGTNKGVCKTTTDTYKLDMTHCTIATQTCSGNLRASLPLALQGTATCYNDKASCDRAGGNTGFRYYFNAALNKCASTNHRYTPADMDVDNTNQSCAKNVEEWNNIPVGQGICYKTMLECQQGGMVAGACTEISLFAKAASGYEANPMTTLQRSSLKIGDKIRIAITGNKANLKARFRVLIDGVVEAPVWKLGQGYSGADKKTMWYSDYEIKKSGSYKFEGQVTTEP